MEKKGHLNLPIPVEDEDDEAFDLPPPYEEAVQSHQPAPGRVSPKPPPWPQYTKTTLSFWKHKQPLQYYPPDPRSIKCRCGRHVNTTHPSTSLPPGHARCICGYIVSSTGYACPPSHLNIPASAPDDIKKCGCGEPLPESRCSQCAYICKCGASFNADGTVMRRCPIHKTIGRDPRNVQCVCGRYVDTTAVWKMRHGTPSLTEGEVWGYSWAGYSLYDYTLPEWSGRCGCGMTVRRDGLVTQEHGSVTLEYGPCCRVLSCKPRKRLEGGGEGCTCSMNNKTNELS